MCVCSHGYKWPQRLVFHHGCVDTFSVTFLASSEMLSHLVMEGSGLAQAHGPHAAVSQADALRNARNIIRLHFYLPSSVLTPPRTSPHSTAAHDALHGPQRAPEPREPEARAPNLRYSPFSAMVRN